MPRLPSGRLIPALALIVLILLSPTLATALPREPAILSAAVRPEATLGFVSQFRDLLSLLWAENGSILKPNGTTAGPDSGAGAINSGDNGSGLDPNG